MGEGCGGLNGGKVSGEWDEQQKIKRFIYICVQLRSWVQKVLHIPIKIKVVVFYFKLYKYIV